MKGYLLEKAAGLTMVTHNVKHFSHIEGIEIEDWVEKP